jgi:hypothetical protein
MLEEHEVCCALFADSTGRGGRAGRHSSGSACCPPRRSTSCARRTAHPGYARAGPRLRAGHAPSRGVARPRRRGVSSRPCGWCWPSAPRRHPAAGGSRHAVRQIISRAVAPEGGVDIFAAAGLRKNVVRARSFAEMLEQTIRRYQPDDRGGAGDAARRCWSSESCASTATARQVGEGHRDCAGAGPAALRTVGGGLTPSPCSSPLTAPRPWPLIAAGNEIATVTAESTAAGCTITIALNVYTDAVTPGCCSLPGIGGATCTGPWGITNSGQPWPPP